MSAPRARLASAPAADNAERQAHLRAYLVATIRGLFPQKADLVSFAGLDTLRRTLIEDLGAALAGMGLTREAAQNLAVEAVGAALAKKAVSWLLGK